MRRPLSSGTPLFGGFTEHECPRCGRPVELPLGALCEPCRNEIERVAARWARWVSVGSTLVLALYLWISMPARPLPVQRLVAGLGLLAWLGVTYLVVKRVAREMLR